jgi:hypothetical protein
MVDWIKAHPWRWALIVLAVAFVLFLLLFGPFLGGGGGEGGTYKLAGFGACLTPYRGCQLGPMPSREPCGRASAY